MSKKHIKKRFHHMLQFVYAGQVGIYLNHFY